MPAARASDVRLEDIRTIVVETMNLLEHKYGIEGMVDLGYPTVDEIAQAIRDEHFSQVSA